VTRTSHYALFPWDSVVTLNYDGIKNFVINGGHGNDAFVVHGTLPGTALSIAAGDGRDLLIAGQTRVTFTGGPGQDIHIGGSTNYDTNAAALDAIMTEWSSTDDFATRVQKLTTGNGVPLLDATTVYSNSQGNTLQGGQDLDLFYAALGSDTVVQKAGDVVIPLNQAPAPVITGPNDGSQIVGPVQAVGTGDPGASVSILDGLAVVGTATVDGSGNWSVALTLGVGVHALSATQSINGHISAASNTVNVTVAPPQPLISSDIVLSPISTVPITVVGETGALFTIYVDGSPVSSGTLPINTLSLTIANPGWHSLTATQTVNGIISPVSSSVSIFIDQAPSVVQPAAAYPTPYPLGSSLTVLGFSALGGLTYTWTASGPGPVGFSANGTNAAEQCTATFTTPGTYTLVVTITDSLGLSTTSQVVVTVPPPPDIFSPVNGLRQFSLSLPVAGTGTPGAVIALMVDGSIVGFIGVNSNGSWGLVVTLSGGTHQLQATQTLDGVTSLFSNPINVTLGTPF
jgi:hypothetical protein